MHPAPEAVDDMAGNDLTAAGFVDMSLPAVSRHLRVLTDAGLIERHTEAQWRRCALRGEGLRGAADWIEFYRRFWEQQFNKLDAFLKRTAPPPDPKPKPKKGKRYGRRT